jgi:hypothetical protein
MRLIILILFLLPNLLLSQKYETNIDFHRTRNWQIGNGIGLHFMNDTFLLNNSMMPSSEACAVHSDTNGNLLLYSNGEKIWNSKNEIIANGSLSLGHNSSKKGSVFILHEDNPDHIYLINTNYSLSEKQLSYNLILREADSFKVIIKDSVLHISVSEPLAVVKAENCKDIWIVSHQFNGDMFISYRLTKSGIVKCPIYSKGYSFVGNSFQAAQFTMSFSSCGKYLVKSNTNIPMPVIVKSVELYEFDLSNGKFEFLFTIDSMKIPIQGIVFSKNNNNIYVVERDDFVNVFNFHPNDSLKTVKSKKQFQVDGFSYLEMQKFDIQNLTYEDKIALVVFDSTYLSVFNDNKRIDSISLESKGISLENKSVSLGLPNFNNSYFYTPSISFSYELNCINNIAEFFGQDTFQANVHSWLISKVGVIIEDSIKNPKIEFNDTGVYRIQYVASNGIITDTIFKMIEIHPKIDKSFLGKDTGWCSSIGNEILISAPTSMHCYQWNNEENTSSISIHDTGVYVLSMTTLNYCVLIDTIVVGLFDYPDIPKRFLGDNISWCANIDTSVILNLPDGYKYYWNTSDTTKSINVFDSGIYIAKVIGNNNCFVMDTLEIKKESYPNVSNRFLGEDVSWCENIDTSILLVSPPGYSYYWNTSDTVQSIFIRDTGEYIVKVIGQNNCYVSDTLVVNMLSAPRKPIVYRLQDSLFTNVIEDDLFNWYKDTELFVSNSKYIILQEMGTYKLEQINENTCKSISDGLLVNYLGLNEGLNYNILVYPNPNHGILKITIKRNEMSYIIYDNLSRTISNGTLNNGENEIIINDLSDGVYWIKIQNNDEYYFFKVNKQN